MLMNEEKLSMFEEGLQEYAIEEYLRYSADTNNLSYWYPYIKDIKSLRIPQTVIVPTPVEIIAALWSEQFNHPGPIRDLIIEHVESNIIPCMEPGVKYFVKNGTFSNKFNFQDCETDIEHVVDSFININYNALIVGAGGLSEFVIREFIPREPRGDTIYNGLQLRPEYRCFWHPGEREVSTIVDYWKYDEVHPNLYDYDDKRTFEVTRERRLHDHTEHQLEVIQRVNESFTGRKLPTDEPWSIDVMYSGGDFWLIDMARKSMSYYANYDN